MTESRRSSFWRAFVWGASVGLVIIQPVALGQEKPAEAPAASQPSTMPAKFDHEVLYRTIAARPLVVYEPKTAKKEGLTEEQKVGMQKAASLMKAAEQSRKKGEFAAAIDQAGDAFKIYSSILGLESHESVGAKIYSQSMQRWSRGTKDKQDKLAESDKLLEQSISLEDDEGKYAEAADAVRKALAIRKEICPEDEAEIGAAYLRLGTILINAEKREEANDSLARALEIYTKVYGEEHPKVAAVLDRIGWLRTNEISLGASIDVDKANAAVDSFMKAVRILTKTQGETVETAESLDNLGTALVYLTDLQSATQCKLRALFIREQVLGPVAKDTGVSLSNLAWLYTQLGQMDEALRLRQRALAIFEKSLPSTHPYIAIERQHLATSYALAGQNDKAIGMYQKMLDEDKKADRSSTPEAVQRLARMGILCLEGGRRQEGDAHLAEAVSRAKEIHSSGKSDEAKNILQTIASGYQQRRRYDEAINTYETLVNWDDKSRESRGDTFEMTQRLTRLGTLYVEAGRFDDAEKALTQCIERVKKLSADDELKLAGPKLSLATVYEKKGDLEKAEGLCDDVVQISETKLGKQAIGTAYAMMAMGRVNALQKRFDLARFSLDAARETLRLYENQDPNGNIRILRELGNCSFLAGETDKAIGYLKDALERSRKFDSASSNIHTQSLVAETLKQLLDASALQESTMRKDRDGWRIELKDVLQKLKTAGALDSEQKTWLNELS